jgi:hypothetical protein
MAGTVKSAKRLMINQANSRIVIYVGVAAFILIFSLVATKTLISQATYQNHVISKKRTAVNQLKTDIAATGQLKTAYDAFNSTPQNVLGGSPTGTGAQDGTNTKVILDALPSSYDFPGLTTSLESLLESQNVNIQSITGTDDEVAQSANQSSSTPLPVPIPFVVSVGGSYAGMQNVVSAFQRSIRPMQIQAITLTGSKDQLVMNVTAQTFYQPAKSLNINKVVVK